MGTVIVMRATAFVYPDMNRTEAMEEHAKRFPRGFLEKINVYDLDPQFDQASKATKATRALVRIYNLTSNCPTNQLKLSYGQSGYNSIARYAYLEAKDMLRELGWLV